MLGRTIASLLTLTLLGCGSSGSSDPSPDAGPSGPIDVELDVRWEPCPRITGEDTFDAECATVSVPLRWEAPEQRSIDVFVKRFPAATSSNGQLWVLPGGPGGSGAGLEPTAEMFASMRSDLDVYIFEHRGVGRSTRLSCPVEEDPNSPAGERISQPEILDCRQSLVDTWGSDLDAFNPTEAARDLDGLIEATRAPSDEVFVYGLSYGTYWALRYLQVMTTPPTGVVLDSTCAPGRCSFPVTFDLDHDAVGRALMELCAADPECTARLPDPVGALTELIAMLRRDECIGPNGPISADAVRADFGAIIRAEVTRPLLPALVYRLQRCEPSDLEAITNLLTLLRPEELTVPAQLDARTTLGLHIILSELWQEPTPQDLQRLDSALVVAGLTDGFASLSDGWPRYEPDELVGMLPTTDVPLLMLQGRLDPQTPIRAAENLPSHFTAPFQTFVELSGSAHQTVRNDAEVGTTGQTCGALLMEGFLQNPRSTPDVTCASAPVQINFAGDPPIDNALLGVRDRWDGVPN